jgi:excisionase family DNA binding protein
LALRLDVPLQLPTLETASEPFAPSEAALTTDPGVPDLTASDTAPVDALAPIATIEELSAYLRLNHKTVREAIARGDIPGVRRIGGAVRIHRDTVLAWLAAGQGRVSHSRRSR